MRFWRVILGMVLSTVAVTPIAHAESEESFPSEPMQPMMMVWRTKGLQTLDAQRIVAAAKASGATPYRVNFPYLPLTAQSRDGVDVMRLTSRWRIALATMVVDQEFIRAVGGNRMADAMATDFVLMGESAAAVRKAKVGDVLMLRDKKFGPHLVTVGAIVPDTFVDNGDIAMSPITAKHFGELKISNVFIVNISSSREIVRNLALRGIENGVVFHVNNTWGNPNPDGILGTGTTKAMLGEFSFRPTANGSIIVSPGYLAKNIVWRHQYADIPLVNNCHREVIPAIQGALKEIKRAGLAKFIDVANSNRSGGCFVGRYNRLSNVYGSPSRHAWGMALDINTETNAQGAAPTLNCGVVRIFRKWGFAWGGTFSVPDGMHFEYVGEARHEMGYHSRFCSNAVEVPAISLPVFSVATTTTSTTTTIAPTTTTLP